MDPLTNSLERVANQLQQTEARIKDAKRKKEELANEFMAAEATLQIARRELEASQQSNMSAISARRGLEADITRLKDSNATLKQEIQCISAKIEELHKQELADLHTFVEHCEHMQQENRQLVQQADATLKVGTTSMEENVVF